MTEDTIAAIITAPGASSVGIIRLSGPDAIDIGAKIYGGKKDLRQMASHTIHYGRVLDIADQTMIDEGLFVIMRAPKSFTGEDVLEIQCHGGSVVLQKILKSVLSGGARLAEAGEYSKRAFLNGKMDLAQAEAIMDIVGAKTEKSLDMSLKQRCGTLSANIRQLRADILAVIAYIQADIDYPDDDIERLSAAEMQEQISQILTQVENLTDTIKKGQIMRDGLKTVIIGKPNVGKSSLMNALLGHERAIVTDIAGTTRDAIEEYVNLKDIPLKIIDTAGIRQTNDKIEQIGIDKAKSFLSASDLVLFVLEPMAGLTTEDEQIIAQIADKPVIYLLNKTDLDPDGKTYGQIQKKLGAKPLLALSLKQNQGLEQLETAIVEMFFGGETAIEQEVIVNNIRHWEALHEGANYLSSFLAALNAGVSNDFLVIDLQSAWEVLGKITGETIEEDLLDQIFSKFCLGK